MDITLSPLFVFYLLSLYSLDGDNGTYSSIKETESFEVS